MKIRKKYTALVEDGREEEMHEWHIAQYHSWTRSPGPRPRPGYVHFACFDEERPLLLDLGVIKRVEGGGFVAGENANVVGLTDPEVGKECNWIIEFDVIPPPPAEEVEKGKCIHCGGDAGHHYIATPYWCLRCAHWALLLTGSSLEQQAITGEKPNLITSPSDRARMRTFISERHRVLIEDAEKRGDTDLAERLRTRRDIAIAMN